MYKEKIIEIGKRLYLKNLTIGTSGNISIRSDKGIFITASGTALGNLTPEEIVLINDEGKEITGDKASSEKMLHTEIYKRRPDIKAIIHTHPAFLTTFAVCHKVLDEPIMSENILYFKEIPVAPYAMPSSAKLVENTAKLVENHDVVMMANHGAVACAADIDTAFLKMETAEYYAQVTLNTKILGGAKFLSDNDIKDLINLKNNVH